MQRPAGEQRSVRISRVAPHDVRGARIEHLERRTAFIPRYGLGGHAARDRVARVELEPEDRSRGVELVVGHPLEHVAYGEEQVLDGEAACIVERHERAALGHELPQRLHALPAEAPGGWCGILAWQPVEQLLR